MEICVPFTDFLSLSPVPYLSRSFKRPGLPRLPRMELVTNGTRSSQTEIPNRNFPKFFAHGKRSLSTDFEERRKRGLQCPRYRQRLEVVIDNAL